MLTLYWYHLKDKQLRQDVSIAELPELLKIHEGVLWLDLFQPTAEELLLLSDIFDFHPLCIEDCVHIQHIPKLEEYPEYLFLVMHAVKANSHPEKFDLVELDAFLGKNFLVTVHREPLHAVDITKEHLERGTSAIYAGSTALAHELLDAMVDLYMPIIEALDTRLQELEDTIEEDPASDIVKDFFDLRRSILKLRRTSLKEQEVFYWLSHRDISFIDKKEALLFKDIYDHLVRIVELSEASRDILSGILSIHLSLMSNRMNDVMRILTIFSAILLPLTFIVGVYGMNFEYMPELTYHYGYFIVLGVMTLIAVGMMVYFRRKNWI
jgi:magnesium transporter